MAQNLAHFTTRLVMKIHIIGAGLAGLAAGVELVKAGKKVILYESAKQAGGRCRSYWDRDLNCLVDNGNHLIVSSNRAALAYIDQIGAKDRFHAGESAFPFYDLKDRASWVLCTNGGSIWSNIKLAHSALGLRLVDYFELAQLALKGDKPVGKGESDFYRRFLSPLIIAALNTEPEAASARLTWQVIRETFGRGEVIPYFANIGLGDSLIDPAIALIEEAGSSIKLSQRLRDWAIDGGQIRQFHFSDHSLDIENGDQVILATPPWVAQEFLPMMKIPDEYRAIVNIHYAGEYNHSYPFLGLIGGLAEWVFFKPGHLSVTISAADHCVDRDADKLAAICWRDLQMALGLGIMPKYRVVKEKRATFAATPAQLKKRPSSSTPYKNLFLAGDWTDTGWPATIEGAIQSGQKAASRILSARQ